MSKELTDLQKDVYNIICKNSKRDLLSKKCELKNKQIYALLPIKTCTMEYITRILDTLQKKGLIKKERRQVEGLGLKRIITIL